MSTPRHEPYHNAWTSHALPALAIPMESALTTVSRVPVSILCRGARKFVSDDHTAILVGYRHRARGLKYVLFRQALRRTQDRS